MKKNKEIALPNWCAVEKDGKVIFEGYYDECNRLIRNLKNSYRGIGFSNLVLKGTKYKGDRYAEISY